MPHFAVTMDHGDAWDPTRARSEQDGWTEHAEFMDGLTAEGFIVLAGPVGDGSRVLLAICAPDEATIRARFAADPWVIDDHLRLARIEPWEILLRG